MLSLKFALANLDGNATNFVTDKLSVACLQTGNTGKFVRILSCVPAKRITVKPLKIYAKQSPILLMDS